MPRPNTRTKRSRFVDWFHSNDKDLWNRFGLIPGFEGVEVTPENFADAYVVFAEQVKHARVRGPHPEWPKISKAIQTAIQTSLTGQAEPADALDTAAAGIEKILAE